MMRNYNASIKQLTNHIQALTEALNNTVWQLCYLKTDDIAKQLSKAHSNRGQNAPTEDEVAFWVNRYDNDMYVLNDIIPRAWLYNVSRNDYDSVEQGILSSLKDYRS